MEARVLINGLILLVYGAIFSDCTRIPPPNRQTDDVPIVLVDIKDFGRAEIARVLDLVNQCSPSVIGVYLVFEESKTDEEDTILVSAIKNSEKVILLANIVDSNIVTSHSKFLKVSKDFGVPTYMADENYVVRAVVPISEYQGRSYGNFSFLLALNHSPEIMFEKSKTFALGSSRRVSFTKTYDDFIVLESQHINCELIKEKIVILGDLRERNDGPSQRAVLDGQSEAKTMVAPVIAANVVLDFLRNE